MKLDAIITVVDALNFQGYEDQSLTAKMQAQFTDLIIINKQELVDARALDLLIDRIGDLNAETPKILSVFGQVDSSVIFGYNTTLFTDQMWSDAICHQNTEIDLIKVRIRRDPTRLDGLTESSLVQFLTSLPKEFFFRIKGFFWTEVTTAIFNCIIINCAFGRCDVLPRPCSIEPAKYLEHVGGMTSLVPDALFPRPAETAPVIVQPPEFMLELIFMGQDFKLWKNRIGLGLRCTPEEITFVSGK